MSTAHPTKCECFTAQCLCGFEANTPGCDPQAEVKKRRVRDIRRLANCAAVEAKMAAERATILCRLASYVKRNFKSALDKQQVKISRRDATAASAEALMAADRAIALGQIVASAEAELERLGISLD